MGSIIGECELQSPVPRRNGGALVSWSRGRMARRRLERILFLEYPERQRQRRFLHRRAMERCRARTGVKIQDSDLWRGKPVRVVGLREGQRDFG